MTPPISKEAGGPASRFPAVQQNRKGANAAFRKAGLVSLLMSVTALGGCAHNFIPPDINYDSAAPAKLTVDPPAPIKIVELPKPLPLPGQLKPIDGRKLAPEAADPTVRVNQANAAARIQPVRNGFINAVQVYPFSGGALYQVYTAPGEITDIALQEGEQLVGSGPVAAGEHAERTALEPQVDPVEHRCCAERETQAFENHRIRRVRCRRAVPPGSRT